MTWMIIDLNHVRPLPSFSLTDPDQPKESTQFSNIQRLLKQDNINKGAIYHEHNLLVQNETVYEYEIFKYYE